MTHRLIQFVLLWKLLADPDVNAFTLLKPVTTTTTTTLSLFYPKQNKRKINNKVHSSRGSCNVKNQFAWGGFGAAEHQRSPTRSSSSFSSKIQQPLQQSSVPQEYTSASKRRTRNRILKNDFYYNNSISVADIMDPSLLLSSSSVWSAPMSPLSTTSPLLLSSSATTAATTTTTTPIPTNPQTSTISVHSIQRWLQQNIFLGVQPSLDLLALISIYLIEGALGLGHLAQIYLLKDELQLGPAELSALTGLFIVPWTIKPFYGFLSDGLPFLGYYRKSYLFLTGILGSISYGILGWSGLWDQTDTVTSVTGTIIALLVSSACIAFSDVVADGIVVTKTRESLATSTAKNEDGITKVKNKSSNIDNEEDDDIHSGSVQSLCWGASAIGALAAAYMSGPLLEVMSPRSLYAITALLPLAAAICSLGIDETPITKTMSSNNKENHQHNNHEAISTSTTKKSSVSASTSTSITSFFDGVSEQIQTLQQAFQLSSIWKPALFLFLWQSTPTSEGAFFYFMTNELGLGPECLGRIQFVEAAAALAGVFLFNQYFKTVPVHKILFYSTIASFPLGVLPPLLLITHMNQQLGIPDSWLIYGNDVAKTALNEICFLPSLVLAARLCPAGIEAALFATLMSINCGAITVGQELGAVLTKFAGITETDFTNLVPLTFFCNLTSLWPLLLFNWLKDDDDTTKNDQQVMIATSTNIEVVPHDSHETSSQESHLS